MRWGLLVGGHNARIRRVDNGERNVAGSFSWMNRRVAAPRPRPAVWRAGLALGLAALPSIAVANWTWQGQNGLIYDSNTNHAARSDQRQQSLAVTQSLRGQTVRLLNAHQALRWHVGAHTAQNLRFTALSYAQAESGVAWSYRPGAGFHAALWSIATNLQWHETGDRLRDGARTAVRASVTSQLTTRLQARVSARFDAQATASDAFSTRRLGAGGRLDWQATPAVAIYVDMKWLDGEFTTTVGESTDLGSDWTRDTAFDVDGERAYRRSGQGGSALLGMNWLLTRSCAADLAMRQTALTAGDQSYSVLSIMADLIYRF